jgi:hypothetical protein
MPLLLKKLEECLPNFVAIHSFPILV